MRSFPATTSYAPPVVVMVETVTILSTSIIPKPPSPYLRDGAPPPDPMKYTAPDFQTHASPTVIGITCGLLLPTLLALILYGIYYWRTKPVAVLDIHADEEDTRELVWRGGQDEGRNEGDGAEEILALSRMATYA
ncbi:hypothetical protein BDW02DRAFT_565934 [Decorospora gaudefroyi]|uniref:Uncharacterized protein n=1 Tax=Decorospora gaudefroyi TaxID=184978 RepID=A0A6A5KJZ2_9PLEO|nr:hypothetical protein BDW02DRAFT_565934 [Decorospora gaudefroyi]